MRPDKTADINYYVHWELYQEPTNIDVGFFTHRGDAERNTRWDLAAEKMDFCVCMSSRTLKHLPSHKSEIVKPGIHPQFSSFKKKIIFGIVGQEYPIKRKGFEYVDQLSSLPNTEFRITGGKIPFDELPKFYSEIDYLLVLSKNEGGPIPLLEAMSVGKPVIAPNVGWCWDYPVIKYNNIEELKNIINTLSSHTNTVEPWIESSNKLMKIFNRAKSTRPDSKPVIEIYQDIYSNGKVVQKGVRGCDERYDALKSIFSKFNRPFSILDIGANFGYFSIRAAEDFGATAVMIQPAPQSKKLTELCAENKNLNLTVLNKRVNGDDLCKLAECERFDVVLALNVLHHTSGDWEKAANAILDLGDTIIFESPPVEDKGACGKPFIKPLIDFFTNLDHEHLGSFKRHTDPNAKSEMIKVEGTKNKTTKSYWNAPKDLLGHTVSFTSDLNERKVNKKFPKESYDWIHGINLQTFLHMGGVFPLKKDIKNKILKKDINTTYLWDNTHGDIAPWNFILNGSNLHLIDVKGKSDWPKDKRRTDDEGVHNTILKI